MEDDRIRKRRAAFFKKLSIAVSPLTLLFFAALAAAGYYYFVYQPPMHEVSELDPIDARISAQGRTERKPEGSGAAAPETRAVTVWVDSKPAAVSVFVDDREVFERPLILPVSDRPVQMRFAADGYVEEVRKLVPDQEQTVVVRLKKQKKR